MEVPFYVEERRDGQGDREFLVAPLFIRGLSRHSELLSKAQNRVVADVRELFAKAGENPRHDKLLEWTFCPEVATEVFDASLLLRHTTVKCRMMIAVFELAGSGKESRRRRVGFSPTIPGLWFDIAAGEDVRQRAAEVYTEHFKAHEKEAGAHFEALDTSAFVRGWVTTLAFEFSPQQKYAKADGGFLAALMGEEKMSGQRELQRVARSLDALYPDELDRAVLREAEVAEVARVLASADMRPALLVGPPMSGKTTIVQEHVFRRRRALLQPGEYRGTLWLLSPQRLISGMMYAGQWENRLLAILDHMKEKEQVLYLDDLPGFYHAGISAQSNLTAAQVLRPYIERREVRVLAEITPESLRVLQERDRGFADLFHVIPVREPSEAEARRVLLTVIRQLESVQHCRFGVEVLPTVMELQGRYVRELALPGKAAVFLKDLAAKYRDMEVSRREVLEEFHSKSGLAVGFLDRRATLLRKDVTESLQKNLIGQAGAVAGMADVVSVAKAQLNDPGRPLGSFLFLGPTGVGKTQAAKALAAYLFGDAERLLRFDMNEYLDAYSAQRLVGTWWQPEGLLTAAVRRQPFGVILLDEIEKADPAVFDLLLQVLGEGRLTDSLGRTSDFTNTIVIMTSNLGVREAAMQFGFGGTAGGANAAADRAAIFRQAAQNFFRPEFFNRIDRIVPFEQLTRPQTQRIADDLIRGVLEREGLRQRKCMLSVAPAAMERIVDAGYHPELGARALKRAIERQLTAPVAARLAAIEPGTPTMINVFPQGHDGIGVEVRGLAYAARIAPPDVSDAADAVKRIDAAMDRLHAAIQKRRPPGRITVGEIAPEHVKYFALKDQFDKVERLIERFEKGAKQLTRMGGAMGAKLKAVSHKSVLKRARVNFRALLAAHDLEQSLNELVESAAPAIEEGGERLLDIVREVALLDAMERSAASRVVLVLRGLGGAMLNMAPVFQFYNRLDWRMTDITRAVQARAKSSAVLGRTLAVVLEHAAAAVIGESERGVHLTIAAGEVLCPVQVTPILLREGEDAVEAVVALAQRQGEAEPAVEQIVRIFTRDIVDMRSGLVSPAGAKSGGGNLENQAMMLAALPVPPEMEN